MSTSKTAPSTPRLSEFARHFVYPSGITKTVWPRVEAKGADLGLRFDWWQSQLGTVCLGYGDDGKYSATVGGIGLSIPRQVGKTYFVLSMLVILCILFPGLQVVWTAHHLRTSTKTFTALRGICRRPKIAPHIRSMRAANGEQQVEFANGSMIMFGARSQGFGRGFDEIDVEVFDEAQILDTKALEDMIAATNQARNEHGALLFFMGTPPRPTDPSDAFAGRRRKAITGKAKNAVWLEMGAEPGSDPDDRKQWPIMNPSYPTRTPEESMLRLRENLVEDDSWNREGRGIWDDDDSSGFFGPGEWTACKVARSGIVSDLAFGVAVSVGGGSSAIAAAGRNAEGLLHVELVKRADGTDWLAPDLAMLVPDHKAGTVAIDGKGPSSVIIPELGGIPLTVLETSDVLDAAALAVDRVARREVVHLGDPELDAAVRGARPRPVGDRFAVGRRNSGSDVCAFEAAVIALWAVERQANYDVLDSIL